MILAKGFPLLRVVLSAWRKNLGDGLHCSDREGSAVGGRSDQCDCSVPGSNPWDVHPGWPSQLSSQWLVNDQFWKLNHVLCCQCNKVQPNCLTTQNDQINALFSKIAASSGEISALTPKITMTQSKMLQLWEKQMFICLQTYWAMKVHTFPWLVENLPDCGCQWAANVGRDGSVISASDESQARLRLLFWLFTVHNFWDGTVMPAIHFLGAMPVLGTLAIWDSEFAVTCNIHCWNTCHTFQLPTFADSTSMGNSFLWHSVSAVGMIHLQPLNQDGDFEKVSLDEIREMQVLKPCDICLVTNPGSMSNKNQSNNGTKLPAFFCLEDQIQKLQNTKPDLSKTWFVIFLNSNPNFAEAFSL